jgi:DNA primase
MRDKKLKILTDVLGSYYRTKDEFLFICPYCNHHKKKFSVNLEKNFYKCWVCSTHGRNVYRVIRKFGGHHEKAQWLEINSEIDYSALEDLFSEKAKEKQIIELPKEFVSLASKEIPPTGFAARNYLRKRGIEKQDIVWWKMGYCCEGEYEGRVIIPSFDTNGDLDYFVSRSYDRNFYPKYKNPAASRNIIFNDLFVDWTSSIVIVEGVFDAIVAGRNSVPLLGSTLNQDSELLRKIVQQDAAVYIALDPDAKKKELDIIKTLLNFDIEVWKVDVGEYDDVGSMSKQEFQSRLKKASLITQDNYLMLTLVSSI